MNKKACVDRLVFISERKKTENGNEQRKRFLVEVVLLRSSLILLFSKASPNHSTQKMNKVFRDETAYHVHGYRPIIFSEAMEICFILNQSPKEHEEERIMNKEENISFLFDQCKPI